MWLVAASCTFVDDQMRVIVGPLTNVHTVHRNGLFGPHRLWDFLGTEHRGRLPGAKTSCSYMYDKKANGNGKKHGSGLHRLQRPNPQNIRPKLLDDPRSSLVDQGSEIQTARRDSLWFAAVPHAFHWDFAAHTPPRSWSHINWWHIFHSLQINVRDFRRHK